MTDKPDPFFIGWAKPPQALRGFLVWVGCGMVALFAGVGYLVAATQADPGNGAFRFDWGHQTVIGVLAADPYPVIHVTESERYATGHTLLLSGLGKRGVQERAAPLVGQMVQASGVALTRGALDMLQVRGGTNGLSAADAPASTLPEPEALGRWRLTGEICDGKCYAGAMRPGTGLAHRACANLCLSGGVPPVFVTTDAVDGESFLLLGDADGGPVTEAVLDHTATLVEIEGDVERRGSILVFRIDPGTIRLAP